MELKAKEIAESFNGEPMVFEVIETLRVKYMVNYRFGCKKI
jgi:hypothetical protein